MFKLLEKIAINFLVKRGYKITENKDGFAYAYVPKEKGEFIEKGSFVEIREPAKIITSKAIQKKRFIKNFGIEINNYKDKKNDKTNF
jgi:hypothetical protein